MSKNGNSIFRGVGVEVDILDNENFLKIKETLTRIGVASEEHNNLYQSCHILHKRDYTGESRYAIVHFKEMFKLDDRPSSLEQKDIERRNTIVKLLQDWSLLKVKENEDISEQAAVDTLTIISYKQKKYWNLIEKYTIGKVKRND